MKINLIEEIKQAKNSIRRLHLNAFGPIKSFLDFVFNII